MRVDFEWDLNGIWRGGIYEAARYIWISLGF